MVKRILLGILRKSGFRETANALPSDLARLTARLRSKRMLNKFRKSAELPKMLHMGCGSRRVSGWVNIDLKNSDVDVDLSNGALPFDDGWFEVVCSQQVIEHLHLVYELEPLFRELHRVTADGAEIWLSCPDIRKVCEGYLQDGAKTLIKGRTSRHPNYTTRGYPSSQFVNDIFHQGGEHKNLFDLELLRALLEKCGFSNVEETTEPELLKRFPDFPSRGDEDHSLYVKARR